jgi:hypothetical protein
VLGALGAPLAIAIHDGDGCLASAEVAQPLHEGGGPRAHDRTGIRAEETDRRQLARLLRARRQRPRRHRAADQRDEFAPLHRGSLFDHLVSPRD